jgi:hypothetical protein
MHPVGNIPVLSLMTGSQRSLQLKEGTLPSDPVLSGCLLHPKFERFDFARLEGKGRNIAKSAPDQAGLEPETILTERQEDVLAFVALDARICMPNESRGTFMSRETLGKQATANFVAPM